MLNVVRHTPSNNRAHLQRRHPPLPTLYHFGGFRYQWPENLEFSSKKLLLLPVGVRRVENVTWPICNPSVFFGHCFIMGFILIYTFFSVVNALWTWSLWLRNSYLFFFRSSICIHLYSLVMVEIDKQWIVNIYLFHVLPSLIVQSTDKACKYAFAKGVG